MGAGLHPFPCAPPRGLLRLICWGVGRAPQSLRATGIISTVPIISGGAPTASGMTCVGWPPVRVVLRAETSSPSNVVLRTGRGSHPTQSARPSYAVRMPSLLSGPLAPQIWGHPFHSAPRPQPCVLPDVPSLGRVPRSTSSLSLVVLHLHGEPCGWWCMAPTEQAPQAPHSPERHAPTPLIASRWYPRQPRRTSYLRPALARGCTRGGCTTSAGSDLLGRVPRTLVRAR